MLPLYGRAYCNKHYPNTLPDPVAAKLCENIEYDFSTIEASFKPFAMATWAVRARMLADAAKEYLKAHPKATVVNLGCGADVSFPAIDNGQCQYINIDLPDVIAAREGMLGGVFYYFKDEQLKPLFCTMAEKFPGGALCFDCENSFGVRKANKMVHKSGNGSMMYFSVDNAVENSCHGVKDSVLSAPSTSCPLTSLLPGNCLSLQS